MTYKSREDIMVMGVLLNTRYNLYIGGYHQRNTAYAAQRETLLVPDTFAKVRRGPIGRHVPAESSHVTGVILQKGVVARRLGVRGRRAGRGGGSSRRARALRST
ncbi:hypothetical protein EVAR_40414_1 [Eumeta japonica]|uniref:Uncharacterized protein n=1 Tax=Eumeta variegata TaxID=151549 RepID=A0A4C1WAT4_EUMVA|nr:hypothetical protein EVAR_40414_1 [Eumeta japonica]